MSSEALFRVSDPTVVWLSVTRWMPSSSGVSYLSYAQYLLACELQWAQQQVKPLVQWLKKLVHIWQKFPCKANCGSDNKAKLVWIFCNKARYRGPVCTKCHNISFMYWFNTGFTIPHTWWTSFCAGSQFSLLWPLPLPAPSWAYSQPGFYKPPLVFYLIPSALAPKAHPHQQEVPIDIGLPCDNIAFFSSFSSYSDDLRSLRSLQYPSSNPTPLPPLFRSLVSFPAPHDSCFVLWTLSDALRFVSCISLMLVSSSAC